MQNLKQYFLIDPEVTFLNFGSFGACPKPVFEEYQKFQLELEKEPVQFMVKNGPVYLDSSKNALANYLNCAHEDLVFVPNPTHALNSIVKNFKLLPGDEVLSTNLEYGACDYTWEYYCSKAGANYVKQTITLPIVSKEKFLEEFFGGVNHKTKIIFISHITSSTALIFPVKEVIEFAKQKNILCIVDGAHAPGHIPLNISQLDCDIYIGACHKWMMGPKGSSFLFVKKQWQSQMDPLIVSWGYKAQLNTATQFQKYHQYNGTRDFSAYLCIPKTLQFMKENNWAKVSEDCKQLVKQQASRFSELLNSPILAPLNDFFIGQMLSLEIKCPEPERLQRTLFDKFKIEIPVMRHEKKVFIRYSISGFNSVEDLDKLYFALKSIRSDEKLIQV